MFIKVIAIACLVATAQAGLVPAAVSTHGVALGPALAPAPALFAGPSLFSGHSLLSGPSLLAGQSLFKAPVAGIAAPALAAPALVKAAPSVDYVAYPKYQFNYGVQDGQTGDQKSQSEIRDGDVVKGSYSLVEPDGTIRTVTYTADDHNGFNAVVSRAGHAVHPATPIAVASKVIAGPALASPLLGHAVAAPLGAPLALGGLLKG